MITSSDIRRQPLAPMDTKSSFLRKHGGKSFVAAAVVVWLTSGLTPSSNRAGGEQVQAPMQASAAATVAASEERPYSYLEAPAKISLYTHYKFSRMSPAAKILASYRQYTHTIPMGNLELPAVLMFVDPDCKQCMNAFKDLMPHLERGALHLEVALVKSPRSAHFYGAADPVRALLAHEVDLLAGGPGLTATVPPHETSQTFVDDNNHFIDRMGITSFPTIVARDPDGKPQLFEGYSPHLTSVLSLK